MKAARVLHEVALRVIFIANLAELSCFLFDLLLDLLRLRSVNGLL
jgi:hypothetical protein